MSNKISSDISSVKPISHNTQGITAKVFSGSFWTLLGQVLPVLVSFFTTPFIIRLLGAEYYGVYILIGLIPSYFLFADFGMNLASTKFGAEAYSRGDFEEEGKVVRTAALLSLILSLPIAAAIIVFSNYIVVWLNIPEALHSQAALALKMACVTFLSNFLCNIFNTPQLSRLRMDLHTFANTTFRLLGAISVPIIIFVGGGIVGATFALMVASLLTLATHLFFSGRLSNRLFELSIDRRLINPLLKFGGALTLAGIAVILLTNLEKIVLTRVASVETLAYYSVAYTLANMATIFSTAMVQSLLPAFSQLVAPEKKQELNLLFTRCLRINAIGLLPMLVILAVAAEPFFTIWAGENFGRESTIPFYILSIGLFFNMIAYIPHGVLVTSGRSDLFAKIFWIELIPYILIVALLTGSFGAKGAAAAWSLRLVFDAFIITWFTKKHVGVTINVWGEKLNLFLLSLLGLLIPLLFKIIIGSNSIWLNGVIALSLIFYFVVVWRNFLAEEKAWLFSKYRDFRGKNRG